MTTIQSALNTARLRLAKQMTDTANHIDAEVLLCHVLKQSRAYLYTHPDTLLTEADLVRYQDLIDKRAQGMPCAYLTGKREFWSLELTVTPDTLIPRPETECLVEAILMAVNPKLNARVLDLGTGSGAIALALAVERPHWTILATDKSHAALTIAQQNAIRLNQPQIEFLQSDWFENIPNVPFDIVVSNPPYLAEHDPHLQHDGLPFEPQNALIAAEDGIHDLFHLIKHAPKYLKSNGMLILEHGATQSTALQKKLVENGYHNIRVIHDLQGLDRGVMASLDFFGN